MASFTLQVSPLGSSQTLLSRRWPAGSSLYPKVVYAPSSVISHQSHVVHCALQLEKRYGAFAAQGLERPTMEDTYLVVASEGSDPSFFGVFDGHGGSAVAELLKNNFWLIYKKYLSMSNPFQATVSAYLEFDQLTLAQPKGLFGALRERGVGGSRCGATAATVALLPGKDGQILVAANVGDARVVLSRSGSAVQLTFDHKPDVEAERKRIESKNPTPKKPLDTDAIMLPLSMSAIDDEVKRIGMAKSGLKQEGSYKEGWHSSMEVVNVGGTWRVGGLLSLSRAFGDAYLKDWSDGKVDGARGGFGLTAEPSVQVETITPEDEFIILATDGIWEKLENQEVVDMCLAERSSSVADIAQKVVQAAVQRGSTDDVSVIVVKLS